MRFFPLPPICEHIVGRNNVRLCECDKVALCRVCQQWKEINEGAVGSRGRVETVIPALTWALRRQSRLHAAGWDVMSWGHTHSHQTSSGDHTHLTLRGCIQKTSLLWYSPILFSIMCFSLLLLWSFMWAAVCDWSQLHFHCFISLCLSHSLERFTVSLFSSFNGPLFSGIMMVVLFVCVVTRPSSPLGTEMLLSGNNKKQQRQRRAAKMRFRNC